ncbi:MAG: Xaa-Pro dipeptidase [Planctomycetota bacterium]|nr:Xaa-Pro dipeptidase [Planctomycetota bacterium]
MSPQGRSLYAEHVAARQRTTEAALAECGYDALVLSSGAPFTYFADDQEPPFHENGHFAHWVPLRGPHHVLVVRPGTKPRLVRVAPEDYWYEQAPLGSPFWADDFDLQEVGTTDAAWKLGLEGKRVAYIGDETARALAAGIAAVHHNPAALVARLDWERAYKSEYEVACMDEAETVAAWGHRAALSAFDHGASELEIHHAYLAAVRCTEAELPYPTIIGHDEKGAILHYTGKRSQRNGRVLLIDAGARHLGYCSDITRTWTRKECDSRFRALVKGMDALQLKLCERVVPGLPYPDLHAAAHVMIGNLLHELGVLKVAGDEAFDEGLTSPFFPHGLGHFLGIQVHDVGGRQKDPTGGIVPPPPKSPFLRTTRKIEEHQVFTIEPGCYFIEMLLRPHRTGGKADCFDWKLIDELSEFGGVRIEDNVLVTASGHRNLTRPHI